MTQVRLYHRAERAAAEAIYRKVESEFEEDGVPVALAEIDEARQIFEVSLYLMDGLDDGGEPAGGADAADVSRFASICGLRPDAVNQEILPDKDWMADVLAALKPVRAGRFLVHGAHDRDKVRSNDLAIEIEAGQAFGTGHHGTTAGCLAMIDRLVARRKPRNALDLGTGSAVLAIALAKLARIPVLATDIDPVATRVASANVRGNGVHRHVTARTAVGFELQAVRTRSPFDLIVANILAGPLMRLAPEFPSHLSADGQVILSGILTTQRRAVLAAFQNQGLYHRHTMTLGEWVTLILSR